MIPALLALLLTQQGPPPALEVTASLDRTQVVVGEEVLYTLRAVGHSTAAFRAELPAAFNGLALVSRSERTDVVAGAGITRAFILELRLRAEDVGDWPVGPVRVEHGINSAFAPEQTVSVGSAGASAGPALQPDLMDLIPRVPAPRVGVPSVYTVASADQIWTGEQVNILTAAWLPRSLRLRLRQAPTLTPPALNGVWTTPRQPVPGAVASRVLEGETYDLYVTLQTVYPLNPGVLAIPAARLGWVRPARQYSGTDRRESAESPPRSLTVRPLPDAGRPPGFDGPVGRDLAIAYELGAASARAGAVLPVTVALSGAGNLPLWPAPRVTWPAAVRAYAESDAVEQRLLGLRVGGVKRFRFSVVPDSAGSLSLPALEYAWFDPGTGSYHRVTAPPVVVPVLEAAPVAERRSPLPLRDPGFRPLAERLFLLPDGIIVGLAAAPFLLLGVVALLRRPRGRRVRAAPAGDPAARLEGLLRALVPPGTPGTPRALAAELRRAGLSREEAQRLVALHGALEAETFGPPGQSRPAPRDAITAALDGLPARIRRRAGLAATVLLLLFGPGLSAQAPLDLYMRGDYPGAARAFRAQAGMVAPSPALWYNVAASEYLANRDADAVAALIVARARAPRDPYVQALWDALAREQEQLRRVPARWPLSAAELLALGLLALWPAAALVLVRHRVARGAALALFLLAGCALALGLARRRSDGIPRAVLAGGVSLRISPHGLSPERGRAPAFSVVELERPQAGWWLVRASGGASGWVPAEILARVPPLD